MKMGDWNLFANQLKKNYERIRIRSHFCGWNVHFVWFMEKGIRKEDSFHSCEEWSRNYMLEESNLQGSV
jgi:hypothetical protein